MPAPDRSAVASEAVPSEETAAELDAERLAMLRDLDGGDGELLAAIANEFSSEASRQLVLLREALAEGDPQAVEQAAHSIKGSSANLGALRLAELAGHLEALGRARALGETTATLDDLAAELERVRVALEHLVVAR